MAGVGLSIGMPVARLGIAVSDAALQSLGAKEQRLRLP